MSCRRYVRVESPLVRFGRRSLQTPVYFRGSDDSRIFVFPLVICSRDLNLTTSRFLRGPMVRPSNHYRTACPSWSLQVVKGKKMIRSVPRNINCVERPREVVQRSTYRTFAGLRFRGAISQLPLLLLRRPVMSHIRPVEDAVVYLAHVRNNLHSNSVWNSPSPILARLLLRRCC